MVAKEIHDCMAANLNAYVYWYLKRYYGMVADADSKSLVAEGEVTKRGYIMGHYAKYATGRTRIQSSIQNIQQLTSDLLVTTYVGTNEYTAVIINRNATGLRIELTVPSEITSSSAIETNETKNMAAIETKISDDKKAVTVGVSPNSIVSVSMKY